MTLYVIGAKVRLQLRLDLNGYVLHVQSSGMLSFVPLSSRFQGFEWFRVFPLTAGLQYDIGDNQKVHFVRSVGPFEKRKSFGTTNPEVLGVRLSINEGTLHLVDQTSQYVLGKMQAGATRRLARAVSSFAPVAGDSGSLPISDHCRFKYRCAISRP
ncbi:hypothetical protein PAXRUDRAFT_667963 [Paxillus rubicundulus Ve08.2h10]|uniref:Uncharacterized protein n=1 Tax=Paxillus rubicundulus Ve08.2h10 TaxID=930991 RepID=A0A0D0DV80_9AGAM|nr:hypothetical protein PAXRUDRAFT_667963 [Paxillus rubicundulus Ve08.2h10]